MDPRIEAICSRFGVFLRREAEALGYDDSAISRHVKSKAWHRVRHGAYVSGVVWNAADADDRYRLYVMAALRQARTPVVASHASAIVLHSGPLWNIDCSAADLTRLDGRTGRNEAGVRQHRGKILEGDVVQMGEFQVTSATRAALELTTMATAEASVCVIDDLLHRGLTTIDELSARYEQMERWPNTLPTDLVLRLADGRSESVAESRARFGCLKMGVPAPVPQLEVRDERGILVGRVDLAWPEHGLFMEVDGRAKYLSMRRENETLEDFLMREKRREEQICAITGWRCIRVTWADLHNLPLLAARLRRLLGIQPAAA